MVEESDEQAFTAGPVPAASTSLFLTLASAFSGVRKDKADLLILTRWQATGYSECRQKAVGRRFVEQVDLDRSCGHVSTLARCRLPTLFHMQQATRFPR